MTKIWLWWLLFVARVTWRNCHARCADWRRTRRGRPRSSTSSCRRTRSAASFSLSAWTASRRWRPELPVDHRPPRSALPHALRRWHANSHSLGTDWNTYFLNHMINKNNCRNKPRLLSTLISQVGRAVDSTCKGQGFKQHWMQQTSPWWLVQDKALCQVQ